MELCRLCNVKCTLTFSYCSSSVSNNITFSLQVYGPQFSLCIPELFHQPSDHHVQQPIIQVDHHLAHHVHCAHQLVDHHDHHHTFREAIQKICPAFGKN